MGCFQRKSNVDLDLKGYHLYLSDGTEVEDEDYFAILPNQSLLVVSPNSDWKSTSIGHNLHAGTLLFCEMFKLLDLFCEQKQNNLDM